MGSYKTVAYGANGGIGYASTGTTVSVPYPSGIAAGQMLILQVLQATATDDIATPSGWTKLGSDSEGSGTTGANSAWFAKVATGSESGNLTVSRAADVAIYFYGLMWRTGTGPKRDATSIQTTTPVSGTSTSASSASITPSTDYSYVAVLLNLEDNTSIAQFTGGKYVEQFDVTSNQGDDAGFAMDGYQQAAAANEPARTATIGGTDCWMTITISIPAAYTWDLAGSIGATASVTGDLKVKRKLAGTIGATSALSGNLKGYWPRLGDWRWYADASPPSTPLAAENTLYTTTSLSTILRLRQELVIEGGKGTSTSGTIDLEYSINQTDWTALGASGHWNWANGADTDHSGLEEALVADSLTRYGSFHESKLEYTDYPSDGDVTEEDFSIVPTANVTANTTYYFRIAGYYGATPVPKAAYGAGTYPQAKYSSGTTHSLAGSVAAQAAVTGNLKVIRKLAGSIAAQSAFVAAEGGKNLWSNADLESGIDDWNAVQSVTISQDGTEKWQGSYALLCTPTGSREWQTAKSDNKAVSPSTQYTLSAYLWSQNAETGWVLSVYDQDAGWLGQAQPDTSAGAWLRFHIHFTTASDTTAIYLHLSRGSTADTGLWRVDAVQLELGGTETEWENYGSGGGLQIIHAVWSLAGSVAAQGAVSGNLRKVHALAGSIAAQSAVTGNLSVHQLRQQSFRWRYNDGTETTATWRAAANANISALYPTVLYRLRFLIQEYGGVTGPSGTQNFRVAYRINAGTWTGVTSTSGGPVFSVRLSGLASGGNTTQQLGTGTFISSNDGQLSDYETTMHFPGSWPAGQETELEIAFLPYYTNLTDGDTIEFRVEHGDGTALDNYANTPSVTVEKPAYSRFTIQHFRFRNDDGDEDAATWRSPLDTGASCTLNTKYRLRFEIKENYGQAVGVDEYPYFALQGNAFPGDYWFAVGSANNYVNYADSASLTNEEDTTQQLTSATPFLTDNNGISEDGWAGIPPTGCAASSFTEVEFVIQPSSVGMVDGGYARLYLGTEGQPGDSFGGIVRLYIGSIETLQGTIAAQVSLAGDLTVVEGGTTWDLAGSVAAQATVAGDAKAIRGLAGSIAAQSAVTGNLDLLHATWDLAGSIAAQAAVSGDLKVTRRLWSTDLIFHGGPPNPSGFKAGANGRIRFTYTPEVTAGKHVDTRFRHDGLYFVQVDTGWGTAGVWLKTYDSGGWHNIDSATGVLTDGVPCTIDVVFSGSSVTGYVDGVEQVSGVITLNLDRDTAVLYDDLVTDDIEAWTYGAGGIKAQAAISGNLELVEGLWSLQGAVAAQSTVSGDAKVTRKLAGAVAAQSALAGDLEVLTGGTTWDLAGSISAQSALTGQCYVPHTYYVAMGGTAANKDAATGPETDLSKCMSNYYNNNTATYDPFDTVFVTGYGGTIDYLSFKGGTSSAARVTYQGSTNYPAIVDGARVTTGWTLYSGNIWQKTGINWHPQQIWIDGNYGDRKTSIGNCVDEYDWYYDAAADTIYLYAPADPDTQYTDPGVEVPEIYPPSGPASYVNVNNITVRRGTQTGCFGWNVSHIKFTGCTFEWSWVNGVGIQGDASTPTEDIVFEDCIGRYNGCQGFAIPSLLVQRGIVFRRCKAYENGRYQYADPRWDDNMLYSGGIKIWNYAEDCLIEDCDVYSNGPSTLGSNSLWFGQGIWLDGAISSAGHENIVRHNRVYDNHGVALYCELTTYSIWHNNLAYDNAKEPDTGNWCNASIRCDARENLQSSHNKFYNNTLVGGQHGIATMVTDTTGEVSYNEFKNNIIIGTNSAKIKATNGGDNITYGHDNVYSHNCLGAEATGFVIWTTAKDTYDAWETAYGGSTNSIEADPELEDEENDKYWLSDTSPCKNAGTNLGATYDDGLHYPSTWPDSVLTLDQDDYGSGWEVGAYVYVGQLAGTVAATAALAGNLKIARSLAGSIAAQSALSGQCYVPKTYYMRADGTATTKATSTGPVTSASACMDLTHHNSYSFDPFDTIVVSDRGGDYRWDGTGYLSSIMDISSSGHAGGGEIHYEADGTPTFLGSYDLTTATYKWTASGSGTNEYYCEAAAGGDPGLVEGDCVWMDTVRLTEGTLGSLADHEWAWGDNDSLGYSTFYIRDNSGDPDTSGVAIEATQRGCVHAWGISYVVVDGLTVKYGNGLSYDGGIRFDETSYCTIQNCEAHHNRGHGISLKGDHGVIDNCHASYNGAHNIVSGGNANNNNTNMEIKNCIAHHSYTMLFVPQPFDGYGIKFLYVDDSSIHNNTIYANAVNGIDLDGDGTNPGCGNNEIYENEIYENDIIGVMIELKSSGNKIHHNRIYNNGSLSEWGHFQTLIWAASINNEFYDNVIYRTSDFAGTNALLQIGDYQESGCTGTKIYNNTMDGGGYCANVIKVDGAAGNATGLKIKNNILVGSTSTPIEIYSTDYTGFECDYNCYDPPASYVVGRNYTGYTKATHCSGFSQDCNSIVDDPLFEDEANHDYSLTGSSPCKNAGTNLGSDYDDGLHYPSTWPSSITTLDQDSYGSAWEVGAYVYVGQLAGAIAAQSALTGNLEISEDLVLQGQIAAQSSLTGAIKLTQKLAGTIGAQSSLAGEAKITRQLAGSVAAQSALTGTLKLRQKLAGAVAAQSALAGELGITEGVWNLAGTVSPLSSLSGALKLQQRLQGTVSAFSSFVGDLQVQHKTWDLGGEIYARTQPTGELRVIKRLSCDRLGASSSVVGNLQLVHAVWGLAGEVGSKTVVQGGIYVTRKLAGALSAQSALTGNLQSTEAAWSLAGSVAAQSSLVGTLVNLSDIPQLLHPYNSWINVYSENVTLTQIPALVVASGSHYHSASNVYVHQQLVVSNVAHTHTVQNVTFVLANPLSIWDALHAISSEEVDLLNSLMIASTSHYHSAPNVNIPYGAEAKGKMGLGDAVFALQATMKLPPYPMREQELLKFCQQLYWQLQTHYIPQTDRIENMTMVGVDAQRPAPVGRRQMFFATDTSTLYIDVKTSEDSAEWFAIAAGSGSNEVHNDTVDASGNRIVQLTWQSHWGGLLVNYTINMYDQVPSPNYLIRETGVVAISSDSVAVWNGTPVCSKLGTPAVYSYGGATATFTFSATMSNYPDQGTLSLYVAWSGANFTPDQDIGWIRFSPVFFSNDLDFIQYG